MDPEVVLLGAEKTFVAIERVLPIAGFWSQAVLSAPRTIYEQD